MRRMFVLSFVLLVTLLAACQGDDTGMMDNDGQSDYQQTRENEALDRNQREEPMDVNDTENDYNRQNQINRTEQNNRNGMNQNNNQNRFDVAEDAAEEVASQVEEVNRAYVMTGDTNAYVAVVMNNNNREEISDEVKKKVSDVVQSEKSDLDNVYVSANADFFDTVNDYVERADEGDPVEGFFEEFNSMLDRVFPNLER
ncbi:YhcN/YlaJ family sporulation lipoprotein [Alkalibacillus almallahensis]|uniref:YhcN/YlaJ family sporulation lipoprotein n=1 Tax=Alkalibacillus almallahensis TaxID=1379154 RepID=UPI00141FE0A3|nr:YhcN/YlaJ family sporulation lipoprotein [Alkalibacillus almallahensis]NIK13078.1 YhcN/YlaJ family sporulation lipoprotein [Alkalibacillus almallahensis]